MIKKAFVGGLCSFLLACGSVDVAQQSVSAPIGGFTGLYESFSCDQLFSEARRVAGQMEVLVGDYSDEVTRSRMEFVGGVVYWPVLFFVDDSADQGVVEEYAQLKGRLDKLNHWQLQKSCAAS
ncbi:MAG: hypothetical protein GY881_11200 [Gammaproteobacteria bacterium]|jgi:hypothetical protein|nr:hypothetical protein [Gammaproteobacteria bacterium]MCP4881771.1 hypothetical protein [Gammaproteobacteria bacterium]MDP6164602.1 hypothetical protein [Gammaproteobacteria bacterium]